MPYEEFHSSCDSPIPGICDASAQILIEKCAIERIFQSLFYNKNPVLTMKKVVSRKVQVVSCVGVAPADVLCCNQPEKTAEKRVERR